MASQEGLKAQYDLQHFYPLHLMNSFCDSDNSQVLRLTFNRGARARTAKPNDVV
jgi:hypothetical protein